VAVGAGNSTTVDLAGTFDDADITDTQIRFDTSKGPVNVELFDKQAPKTVANFLNYVTGGDYTNSIFHRSALSGGVPFVLQGGGFTFSATPSPALTAIPTDPPVQNEPDAVNRSNVKGTLAMAKLSGNPNSATDQFFFNLGDNSALDTTANGAFTVFGKVMTAADQTVVDQLAAIPTKDERTATALPASELGVFGEIPLQSYTGTNFPTDTTSANYALVTGVSIVKQTEALTYSIVTPPNAAVATATVTNNRLNVTGVAAGTTTITVQATDKAGNTVQTTVTVTVA
jgi:cyclophilin family peptidyl-prolyl cis-trans isomerase